MEIEVLSAPRTIFVYRRTPYRYPAFMRNNADLTQGFLYFRKAGVEYIPMASGVPSKRHHLSQDFGIHAVVVAGCHS